MNLPAVESRYCMQAGRAINVANRGQTVTEMRLVVLLLRPWPKHIKAADVFRNKSFNSIVPLQGTLAGCILVAAAGIFLVLRVRSKAGTLLSPHRSRLASIPPDSIFCSVRQWHKLSIALERAISRLL